MYINNIIYIYIYILYIYITYIYIYIYIYSFIRSFVRSPVRPSGRLPARPPVRPSVRSFVRSFIHHSFVVRSFIRSFIHHSFARSFILSFIHSRCLQLIALPLAACCFLAGRLPFLLAARFNTCRFIGCNYAVALCRLSRVARLARCRVASRRFAACGKTVSSKTASGI